MSKKWKIILGITAGFMLLCVVVIGALVFGGIQVYNSMKAVAQEVYGGPMDTVIPLVGMKTGDNKMAVFMNPKTGTAVVIVQAPKGLEEAPLSEPDVEKALSDFRQRTDLGSVLDDLGHGSKSELTLGGETIHTMVYNTEGDVKQAGLLNLDNAQMLFIANGNTPDQLSEGTASFLSQMPALKRDSRLKLDTQKETVMNPTP